MKKVVILLAALLFSFQAAAQTYVPDQRPKSGQVAYANKANIFTPNQTWLGTNNAVGTIGSGIWQGSAVAVLYGGTGATTASGARTNLGLAIGTNVEAWNTNLDAVAAGTWAGDSSIATVGTITSGTWNGSTIGNTYLTNASTTVNGTTCTLGSTCSPGAAAGGLTGSTLAAGVTASSLTSVGTLTGGATGSGFTLAFGSSTMTGTVPTANGGLGANEGSATGVVQMASGTTSISTGLASGTTATTQSASDTTTKVATDAFVFNNLFAGYSSGRLTLTSATPVTTGNVTAATTIYFTPYKGNQVPVWNGTNFLMTTFTELSNVTTASSVGSAGPAAVAASKVYDLYVWSNSGSLTLTRSPAWTSTTSRGTGAGTAQQSLTQGVYTNTVAITNGPGAGAGTYVGTVYSDASSQIDDSLTLRNVWNEFNRVLRPMSATAPAATWTYTTAAWAQADASTAAQLNFVVGEAEDEAEAFCTDDFVNSGGTTPGAACGIGLNSTSSNSANTYTGKVNNANAVVQAQYDGIPPIGVNFLAWLEWSVANGTTTWQGSTSTNPPLLTGIAGHYPM